MRTACEIAVPVRIYLCGVVAIEAASGALHEEREFPGRQGRLAFAYLVLERRRAVTRDELAEVLWPRDAPPSVEASLSAILSKLRALLARAGLDRQGVLTSAFGAHRIQLPPDAWVDVEAAQEALHEAEAMLKSGDAAGAYGPAGVAFHIAERCFLAGDVGRWVDGWRQRLHDLHVRALECNGRVYVHLGEPETAVEVAKRAVDLEPFRETAYQLLMAAHVAAGNPAAALWAYERCRQVLREELGVAPSPSTRELHLQVMRAMA